MYPLVAFWEKSLLYLCYFARPTMANASTNDHHTMAVNHIGDAVHELTCFNPSEITSQSDTFRIGCQIFREFMVVVGLH